MALSIYTDESSAVTTAVTPTPPPDSAFGTFWQTRPISLKTHCQQFDIACGDLGLPTSGCFMVKHPYRQVKQQSIESQWLNECLCAQVRCAVRVDWSSSALVSFSTGCSSAVQCNCRLVSKSVDTQNSVFLMFTLPLASFNSWDEYLTVLSGPITTD